MASKEEIRGMIERGRRYRIAGEVLNEFLEDRKQKLIRKMEEYSYADEDLRQFSTEFQMIRAYRDCANQFIQRGEIAEKELSRNGE